MHGHITHARRLSWLLALPAITLLVACTATPPPGAEPTLPAKPLAAPTAAFRPELGETAVVTDTFVANQIIVTGAPEDVRMVLDTLGTRAPAELEQKEAVDLGALGGSPTEPGRAPAGPPVVMHLYAFADSGLSAGFPADPDEVPRLVAAINDTARALDRRVTADPNYLLGNPWTIEGSPVPAQRLNARASGGAMAFRDQWALSGASGIGLHRNGRRSIRETGRGVRIGVFDTSPFGAPGPQPITGTGLALTVVHPTAAAMLPPTHGVDLSSHGLFVAGLVNAVAPDSEIQLIRVLNSEARGDLFTLNRELASFVAAARQAGVPAVINLSLGIHAPSGPERLGDILSLNEVISRTLAAGVVIVAAAGNGSSPTSVANMESPAVFPSVIGVAASNAGGGRACFSNKGDLAAPGGNGDPACRPADCVRQPSACVISLTRNPTPGTTEPFVYAYWAGSSYAAPLVTGLAALALERGVLGTGNQVPAAVATQIAGAAAQPSPADANLGAGVINVPRTLP